MNIKQEYSDTMNFLTTKEKITFFFLVGIIGIIVIGYGISTYIVVSNDRFIQSAFGSSYVGNFADGYDLGKEHGAEDRQDGYDYSSKCPDNTSLTWCTGYKAGYEIGWDAAGVLGGGN